MRKLIALAAGIWGVMSSTMADARVSTSPIVTVSKISYDTRGGQLLVQFSSSPASTNCSLNPSGAGWWAVNNFTADTTDDTLKILLFAKEHNTAVRLVIDDTMLACTGDATSGTPYFHGIRLE